MGNIIVTSTIAHKGMRVRRGRDWNSGIYGKQDADLNGEPGVGVITSDIYEGIVWISVTWDNGRTNIYRIHEQYDLYVADDEEKNVFKVGDAVIIDTSARSKFLQTFGSLICEKYSNKAHTVEDIHYGYIKLDGVFYSSKYFKKIDQAPATPASGSIKVGDFVRLKRELAHEFSQSHGSESGYYSTERKVVEINYYGDSMFSGKLRTEGRLLTLPMRYFEVVPPTIPHSYFKVGDLVEITGIEEDMGHNRFISIGNTYVIDDFSPGTYDKGAYKITTGGLGDWWIPVTACKLVSSLKSDTHVRNTEHSGSIIEVQRPVSAIQRPKGRRGEVISSSGSGTRSCIITACN